MNFKNEYFFHFSRRSLIVLIMIVFFNFFGVFESCGVLCDAPLFLLMVFLLGPRPIGISATVQNHVYKDARNLSKADKSIPWTVDGPGAFS